MISRSKVYVKAVIAYMFAIHLCTCDHLGKFTEYSRQVFRPDPTNGSIVFTTGTYVLHLYDARELIID